MITYIYFNIFISILSLKDIFAPKILNRVLYIVLITVLIVFVGLRYEVGGDWVPYKIIYNDAISYDLYNIFSFSKQDPLFYFLNYLVVRFGYENGNVFINLIVAFFVFYTFYKFITFNKLNFLSFVIFYPFIIIVLMGFMRQSIALGFLFLILSNNLEKNQIKNLLWAFLASQFHFSGYVLLLIPLYVLAFNNKSLFKPINLLISFSIFFIIAIYAYPMFKFKFWVFETFIDSTQGGLFKNLPIFFSCIICLFFYKFIFKDNVNNYFYLALSVLSIFCYFSIFILGSLSDRLLVYSIPILIFTLSKFYDRINSSYWKIIYFFSIIIFFLFFMIGWFEFSNSSIAWIPYNIYLIN